MLGGVPGDIARRYSRTPSVHGAEDLEQDMRLKAWVCRNYILSASNQEARATVVLENVCRDRVREVARDRAAFVPDSIDQVEPASAVGRADCGPDWTIGSVRRALEDLGNLRTLHDRPASLRPFTKQDQRVPDPVGGPRMECDRGVDTPARVALWDIEDALRTLPDDMRVVLELAAEGHSDEEIAFVRGMNRRTVNDWCSRQGPREVFRALVAKG